MPSVLEIETEVLRLGTEDRARILARPITSFEPDSKIESAWTSEALRREAEVLCGTVQMVPGPGTLGRIRARIA